MAQALSVRWPAPIPSGSIAVEPGIDREPWRGASGRATIEAT